MTIPADVVKGLVDEDTIKAEDRLVEFIQQFENDPLGFAESCFPWGEPGTFLKDSPGLDTWQEEFLRELGKACQANAERAVAEAIQMAACSGNGVGKSTLVAIIILWFISTRSNPTIKVTANTKDQIISTTWRELAKWHGIVLNKHWFEWSATTLKSVTNPATHYAKAIPWSVQNSQAFAGTHETRGTLQIFDEGSGIDDEIWKVAMGNMTTAGAVFITFGNPTRNTGYFADIFGDGPRSKSWKTFRIDSRKARMTDKKLIAQWAEEWGEDSDWYRVHVLGKFPKASSLQFIPKDYVERAFDRVCLPANYSYAPIILGVDVAREGDDSSVITVRQGPKIHAQLEYREMDGPMLAEKIAEVEDAWRATTVCIDLIGVGYSVYDWGHKALKRKWYGINVSEKAGHPKYFNRRIEIWDRMKEWFKDIGDITSLNLEQYERLTQDCTSIEYDYTKNRMKLEAKKDLKARGIKSPDFGDSLALTFAVNVKPQVPAGSSGRTHDMFGRPIRHPVVNADPRTGY